MRKAVLLRRQTLLPLEAVLQVAPAQGLGAQLQKTVYGNVKTAVERLRHRRKPGKEL